MKEQTPVHRVWTAVQRAGLSRAGGAVLLALVSSVGWSPEADRSGVLGEEVWSSTTLPDTRRRSVAMLAELAGYGVPRGPGGGAGDGRRVYDAIRELEAAGLVARRGTGARDLATCATRDGRQAPHDRSRLGRRNDYDVFPRRIVERARARGAVLAEELDGRALAVAGLPVGHPDRPPVSTIPRHEDPSLPAWLRGLPAGTDPDAFRVAALAVARAWHRTEPDAREVATIGSAMRGIWRRAGEPAPAAFAASLATLIRAARECAARPFAFGVRGVVPDRRTGYAWKRIGEDRSVHFGFVVAPSKWGERLHAAELHARGECGCPPAPAAGQEPGAEGVADAGAVSTVGIELDAPLVAVALAGEPLALGSGPRPSASRAEETLGVLRWKASKGNRDAARLVDLLDAGTWAAGVVEVAAGALPELRELAPVWSSALAGAGALVVRLARPPDEP